MTKKFENWYDKNYKKILIIPAVLLFLSFILIGTFYIQTREIIHRDISLKGGTTITIFSSEINYKNLETNLSQQSENVMVEVLSDNFGIQTQIVVTSAQEATEVKEAIESFIGYELTDKNSNIEFTSSELSGDFYNQLIVAIIIAFFWMAAIVFVIFTKNKKLKIITIILNIIFGVLIGTTLFKINFWLSVIPLSILAVTLIYTYIRNSVPSFAVMFSAFADIVMTLAVVNLLGMKLSTAGIVAFLMLIGYSVDTDILLTTRMLKKKNKTNKELFGAFKTGVTMTLTSMIAVAAALIAVYSFNSVLNQIFIILLIGLGFDLLNTWITNASIIKWYVKNNENNI